MEEQEIQGKINIEITKLNNEKDNKKRDEIQKKIKILKLKKQSAIITKRIKDLNS